jgi:hypothetical protein
MRRHRHGNQAPRAIRACQLQTDIEVDWISFKATVHLFHANPVPQLTVLAAIIGCVRLTLRAQTDAAREGRTADALLIQEQ